MNKKIKDRIITLSLLCIFGLTLVFGLLLSQHYDNEQKKWFASTGQYYAIGNQGTIDELSDHQTIHLFNLNPHSWYFLEIYDNHKFSLSFRFYTVDQQTEMVLSYDECQDMCAIIPLFPSDHFLEATLFGYDPQTSKKASQLDYFSYQYHQFGIFGDILPKPIDYVLIILIVVTITLLLTIIVSLYKKIKSWRLHC